MDYESKASEIYSWLSDAVGDASYGMEEMAGWDPDIKRKITIARKNGVTDIAGWLADDMYNNVQTVSDLLGDRIHDDGHGNYLDMLHIASELCNIGHDAVKTACQKFIEEWRKNVAPFEFA